MQTLNLPYEWEFKEDFQPIESSMLLGDNYKSVVTFGTENIKETLTVKSTLLTKIQKDSIHNYLKLFQGVTPFLFRDKIYTCSNWVVKRFEDQKTYQISTTFTKGFADTNGDFIEAISDEDLNNLLDGTRQFLELYSGKTTEPYLANAEYGLKNSFHKVFGRGGYFYFTSGTSEGQFLIVRACIEAFKATNNIAWKNLALSFASYFPTMYAGEQPPSTPNTKYLPHWLFNVGETFPTKEPIAAKPINSGVFQLPVTFTNGVGTIASGSPNFGERISDVTVVTDGELLWKNVYSDVISGIKYEIDYWVVNLNLSGSNFRLTPKGIFTPTTTETPGKIKLTSNFSGTLKVTFLRYSNTITISNNELYDAYPCWRELESGESNVAMDSLFWGYYAYQGLYDITNDTKWLNARNATAYTLLTTSQIINLTHWYKKSSNPEPLEYPGSQIIQSNNPNAYTVTRLGNQNIEIGITANPGFYPAIELQNFAVQVIINPTCTIYAEVALSVAGYVQLVFSLAKNAFDFSKQYIYNWKINGTSLNTRTIKPKDFIRWNTKNLTWFPSIADNPVYTYQGSGSTAVAQTFHATIGDLNPMVWKINFTQAVGGFAGAGLVLEGKKSTQPPRLCYRVVSGSVILRIKDGSERNWDKTLITNTTFQNVIFGWAEFAYSSQNTLPLASPDGLNNILGIEFVAISGNSEIQVYWASIGGTPDVLEDYAIVYKGSIKDTLNVNHALTIGDFKPVGSISDNLKYNPGVVPFTTNTINKNTDSWRGVPYAGYQDSAVFFLLNQQTEVNNVLDFAVASQKAYQESTGLLGPFCPVYSWAYWDSGDYAIDGVNSWGWLGADPNTHWEGYQYRFLEALAKHWYFDKRNNKCRLIVLNFLNFLDSHYLKNNTNRPPTDYPEAQYPSTLYDTPHGAALILRAAIYANLAGGNPGLTSRIISRNWEYLKSQYVSSGLMNGSFSASQPVFNTSHREYFGFWHGEIIEAISLLKKHKNNLIKNF